MRHFMRYHHREIDFIDGHARNHDAHSITGALRMAATRSAVLLPVVLDFYTQKLALCRRKLRLSDSRKECAQVIGSPSGMVYDTHT